MPKMNIPENAAGVSLFKTSPAGLILTKNEIDHIDEKGESYGKNEKSDLKITLMDSFFWQFVVAYAILCVRIKTVQGWVYSWMEWTFAE